MIVKLIAQSVVDYELLDELGFAPAPGQWASDADHLAEFAGRNCYLSFDRPNPKTAVNADYLGHILEIGHESVLEHSSATFYIEASRSVLVELERHRHLSFSVVSQRYVDASTLGYHVPPVIRDWVQGETALAEVFSQSVATYEYLVKQLQEQNLPRKQAREAARAVLPGMMNTPMVASGNLRAWRYVISLRNSPHADAEIREVAKAVLTELKQIAPATFQDMEV